MAPKVEPKEGPKVVGKVDLDALSPKKAAKRKETEEAPAKEAEAAEAKASPEAAEQPAKADAKNEAEEPEVVRAKVEKLSGPTVVGKIELPVERKRTAAKPGEDGKRKRVRVKKVDVSKAGESQPRPRPGPRPQKRAQEGGQQGRHPKEIRARSQG